MSNEPEVFIDPYDGGTVPCVMCMAAPQLVGTGTCSDECADALEKWMEEDSMSDQVSRLQAAVRQLLESLNALEYSHYNTRNNLEAYRPSTLETYGLTQKDMQ